MKVDTQSVLADLQSTRATLCKDIESINDEVERLLAKQEAVSKQISSLDVVIGIYSQGNESENEVQETGNPTPNDVAESIASQETDNEPPKTEETDFQLNAQTPVNGKKSSLRQIVRNNLDRLPTLFTKEDIEILVAENGGADRSINDNTLASIIRSLKDDNLIEVKVPATGRAKQIYTKAD